MQVQFPAERPWGSHMGRGWAGSGNDCDVPEQRAQSQGKYAAGNQTPGTLGPDPRQAPQCQSWHDQIHQAFQHLRPAEKNSTQARGGTTCDNPTTPKSTAAKISVSCCRQSFHAVAHVHSQPRRGEVGWPSALKASWKTTVPCGIYPSNDRAKKTSGGTPSSPSPGSFLNPNFW